MTNRQIISNVLFENQTNGLLKGIVKKSWQKSLTIALIALLLLLHTGK